MAKEKVAKTSNNGKLGLGRLLLWSSQGVARAVHIVMLGSLMIYCTNALHINSAIVGTIMMVSKIIDSVTDLMAGFIIDKTNTKLGRGRPYSLCVVGLWFATWLLFSVPEGAQMTVKIVWIFLAYALSESVFLTFMSASDMPYMVRAFNNQEIYVKLSSFGGLITTIVIVVFNVTFPLQTQKILDSAPGWSRLILMIAIPMAAIGLLRFLFIPEKYVMEDRSAQKIKLADVGRLLKENKNIYPIIALQIASGLSSSLTVSGYYYLYIVGNYGMLGIMSMLNIVAMIAMIFFPRY